MRTILKTGLFLTLFFPVPWAWSGILQPDYLAPKVVSYQKKGRVDRITGDRILLGDRPFRLAPDVEFHSLKYRHLSRSRIRKGDVVALVLDKDGVVQCVYRISD